MPREDKSPRNAFTFPLAFPIPTNVLCHPNIQCVICVLLPQFVSIRLDPTSVSVPLILMRMTSIQELLIMNSLLGCINNNDLPGNFRMQIAAGLLASLPLPPTAAVRLPVCLLTASPVVKIFIVPTIPVPTAIVPPMPNVSERIRPWIDPITNASVLKDSWEVAGPVNPRTPNRFPKSCLMV